MKRFLSIFFAMIFTLVSVMLYAQELPEKKDPTGWKKADKLYQQRGYMASATKYQMKYSDRDMKPEVMLRIANSYRLNGEAELAEYWYAKCIHAKKSPENMLHYAEVLQTIGKCEDAIRWYDEYKRSENTDREFISDCSELKSFKIHENVEVENLKALNTKHLDYSAMMYDDGVIFTSTRGVNKVSKMTDNWTKGNFSDVFFAKKDEDGNYSAPNPIPGKVNKKYHDGVTSITKSGTVMFFSRNHSKKKKKKSNVIDLKIYQSIFVDGAWKDATMLEINDDAFASCHPSVSDEGKWLYFASNRPGGFGGMDIYVSENVDGKWQEPQNLGPTVNSAGNELFPHVNEEGLLFFASNGHKGMGGLDIFVAEKSSMYDESSWNTRKNIGTPFNSKKDDFGFYTNAEMTEGFLTSNRFGGKGGDDIYNWKTNDNLPVKFNESIIANFRVVDKLTQNELRNAMVVIDEVDGILPSIEMETNGKGRLEVPITEGKNYKVTIEKEGYILKEKEVPASELMSGNTIVLDMEKIKCIEVFGTVMNEKYKKAIPNASVTLINKCTGEKTVVNTQSDGAFDFCLDNGCDFEIVASKNAFVETETMISTIGNASDLKNNGIKIEMIPVAKPVKTTPVKTPPVTSNPGSVTANVETKEEVKKHFLGSDKATFHVGQVLTLKNIYYDFNKSNIRKDAGAELDHVVTMMKQFPQMEITLSSHTDARGRSSYNKRLSDKRAKSARQYILSRGIEASRIIAVGYGEEELKNDCKDGVDCPDKEHQFNRRTEVLINKMD